MNCEAIILPAVRKRKQETESSFFSPIYATVDEDNLIPRRDRRNPNVRYASLLLPKPDAALSVVRAATGLLRVVGERPDVVPDDPADGLRGIAVPALATLDVDGERPIPAAVDVARANERLAELRAERGRLAAASEVSVSGDPHQVDAAAAMTCRKNSPTLLERATPAERKELVRACVEVIRLAPEQLEVSITYRVPEPAMDEAAGRCQRLRTGSGGPLRSPKEESGTESGSGRCEVQGQEWCSRACKRLASVDRRLISSAACTLPRLAG